MKKLNVFTLLAIVALFAFGPSNLNAQIAILEPGDICLKDPSAEHPTVYFSTGTSFVFEVYRASKADVERILSSIRKDPAVESFNLGTLTGDYQAFTLLLKSAQNKEWFAKTFKNAGLNNIRINRHDIMPVDKM